MKKLISALLLIIIAHVSFGQVWKLDQSHSKIKFSARYMLISDVDGEFKSASANITSSKPDWSDLKADVTIPVNSITTENEMRDKHLMSDDFFNAEKYPNITFKSTGIRNLGGNKYLMAGNLTIRDVTKSVELPLVYGGTAKDAWGNTKAGFKATGKINRKEFGLKYKDLAATGEAVVGDEVEFTVDMILVKQIPN